jgi:hypothetical protein
MGLPLIGLAISAGSSFLSAGMQASAARGQAEVAKQQLKYDMENERIKGMQEGTARQEEYLRNEASNRVAIAAATGGGRNMSYDQGLGVYNKDVMGRDIDTLRYNSSAKIGRMRYEIAVNNYNAKAASRSAFIGAAGDTAGALGSYLSRPGGLLA